jgi:hypothetical protein
MAKVTVEIIEALRKTASSLQKSKGYQWGHMGSCNCGFLAQEITHLRKEEIHAKAMQRHGDWSEQLNDYCPTSGLPFDDLINELIVFGFDADDLKHLERLSSGVILRSLPLKERNLQHNIKADVVKYLLAWAELLENQLVDRIQLPAFEIKEAVL